jgi:uncharacterized membrane protein YoaK (UPF0700 family)
MKRIEAEVNTTGEHVRDALLVALTVASGAVDAVSYFGLGHTFSAFMSGNMVFLGFGIAHIKGQWLPIVLALSTFAVGSYVGLRIATGRTLESGWWPPRMSLLLALVALAEAGFLAVWSATAGHPPTEITCVLIVFFSLAMGIQTAAVRSLDVQGVFTTAGTFTLVAVTAILAGARSRAEMPRLVGVLAGLVGGAIAGGLLFLHARSYAPALPLAITVLVILAGRKIHDNTQSAATTGSFGSTTPRRVPALGQSRVGGGEAVAGQRSALVDTIRLTQGPRERASAL